MPAPYSNDLRIRVIDELHSNTYTIDEIATRFKVSVKSIKRWNKLKLETGSIQPRTGYQKGHSHVIKDLNIFKSIVQDSAFGTLQDIVNHLKVGTIHSISRALKKIKYVKKKV